MRKILIVVIVTCLCTVVWAQGGAPATSTPGVGGETSFTCPVDQHTFSVMMPGSAGNPSVDSDGCFYVGDGTMLLYRVIVCPRCNYATNLSQFKAPLKEDARRKVLEATADSRYRGVADPMLDIPPWERAELGFKCSKALDQPLRTQVGFLLAAAWSARIEAVLPAVRAYPADPLGRRQKLPDPLDCLLKVGLDVKLVRRQIAREFRSARRNRLKLLLAMLLERAGQTAERDEVLAELEKATADDASIKPGLAEFRRLIAIETAYQKRAVTLLDEILEKDDLSDAEKIGVLTGKADTLRRLGRKEEAVKAFRELARIRQTLPARRLTEHLLTRLAPGEPIPEPAKKAEASAKKSGKETPTGETVPTP